MHTKLTTALALTLAAGTLLAGCSAKQPAAAGEEVKSGGEESGAKPKIRVTIYDRGNVPPEEGTITNNRWTKWIQANAPVDVEFVAIPRNEYAQKLNALFAAGDAPDLILEYDPAYQAQLYNTKQIMPLDDLIQYAPNYKQILDANPALRKAGTYPDGKLYVIGNPRPVEPLDYLLIRRDWLSKLGLAMPATLDDFYNVLKAFKEKDPDGNGKDDTFGMNLSQRGQVAVHMMFGNRLDKFEKHPWVKDQQGNLEFGWDNLQAAVAFQKKLYDNGLVSKDYLTDDKGQKADQDFINGKLGVYSGYDQNTLKKFRAANPDADLVPMPLPTTTFGSFSAQISPPFSNFTMINKNAKNPKAVMEFINFMLTPEAKTMFWFGVENQNYAIAEDGCPDPSDFSVVNNKQLVYTSDMRAMFVLEWNQLSKEYGKCYGVIREPKARTPEVMATFEINKWYKHLQDEAKKVYVVKERPEAATYILQPIMPDDLQINQTNGYKAIYDNFQKAIVSGSSYTVDQAVADSRKAWELASGGKVEAWMKDWWQKGSKSIPKVEDLYP
ncbi:Lipoprotein LipO precursor [Paenibacillus konkukensis]|uniref:Lipoprotein LipO n=1 Tax=Paenibacillus konkukensis TaxID=2020716 RepID=A0ABY4RMQ4_9BACL|nr:extracellular solute-binding protein [Paenibacillus konkukensis]UQZ83463.1 Lipoprotein LipO precursor [Paenibacillus konkukensis]